MDQSFFMRQLDIADPTRFKDKSITVIGAGGIGEGNDNLRVCIEGAVEGAGMR